jgi:hypothetical protein
MTIKQQGGIFGRNPVFNDLEANSADVRGLLKVSNEHNENFIELSSTTTDDEAFVKLASTDLVIDHDPTGARSSSDIALNSDGVEVLRIKNGDSGGDLQPRGNVVFAEGKGIDFSATSGTGTSELFSDYEEGEWTPTLTTDGTDFSSVTYDGLTGGYYTKIGDLVVARGRLRTDAVTVGSASGNVLIGGLPFTVGGGAAGRAPVLIGEAEDFSTNNPSGGRTIEGSVTARLLYRSSANGAATSLPVSSIDTGSNKNQVSFTAIYRV